MEDKTLKPIIKSTGFLLCLLLTGSLVQAGGVDPREVPQERVAKEKVTATPAETSAAVSKARRAVAPAVKEKSVVKEVPMTGTQPKAVTSANVNKNSWLLSSPAGACEPLSAASRKAKIGSFSTPGEFARQLKQRGYQAFVLDIGDVRDQVVRVKVPDQNLDLTFKKAELCR